MARRKEIQNTKEEKIEIFNFKNSFIETAVNIHPTQEYKKLSLEEFYKIVFGRSDKLKQSNFREVLDNIDELDIPFQSKEEYLNKETKDNYKYNNICVEIINKNLVAKDSLYKNSKTWIINKELDILESLKYKDFVAAPPVTYVGKKKTIENSRVLYSIVIDLDYVYEDQIQYLLLKIQLGRIPMPNLIVNSGTGVHLYYILKTPVMLYGNNRIILDNFKKELIDKVWDSYTSLKGEDRQYQNNVQSYRLPETLTKFGEIVTCYLNIKSSYTSLFALAEELNFPKLKELQNYIPNYVKEESDRMKFVRENYPDWYERRIVNKEPVDSWKEEYAKNRNKGLYNWWLKRIKEENIIKVGYRYHCVLATVAFATKSNIPKAQVKKDLLDLLEYLDEMTIDEDNHFTIQDINDALKLYGTSKARLYKKDTIAKMTNVPFKENKVNGRSVVEHAQYMRNMKVFKRENNIEIGKDGRPSVYEDLKNFIRNNFEITNKSEIARQTGLSRQTVFNHYNKIFEEISREIAKEEEIKNLRSNPFDL